jgi:hypothetical protein
MRQEKNLVVKMMMMMRVREKKGALLVCFVGIKKRRAWKIIIVLH